MIKANELRIGNWVKYHDDTNIRVTLEIMIAQNHANKTSGHRSWIYPIPLTPEILEKWCGFTRKGYVSSNGSKISVHHIEPLYPNGRIYFNSWCIMNKIPKYLHEFQNLYFALTGEELPVNL